MSVYKILKEMIVYNTCAIVLFDNFINDVTANRHMVCIASFFKV